MNVNNHRFKYEYVQFGCGLCAPDTWLNFDSSPTLRFQRLPVVGLIPVRGIPKFPRNVRYGDIVSGLPVPASTCKGIYCSHVLEHLTLDDFRTALRNTYAYLRQGGIFRLVVPDLDRLTEIYRSDDRPEASINFMEWTGLGVKSRPASLREMVVRYFGGSQHQWMWDEKAIRRELQNFGFVNIRRAAFGDSGDMRFLDVEHADRFVDAVAMQCER